MGGRAKEIAVERYDFTVSLFVAVAGCVTCSDETNGTLGSATTEAQQSDLQVQTWECGREWEVECARGVSGRACDRE